jgi:hypothetical protein
MAKVTSFTIKQYPTVKVIGLAYRVKMMDNEIPKQWDLFFKEDKHVILEDLRKKYPIEEPLDYVGLMHGYDPVDETMIYLIGAIMDESTPDPKGYTSVLLPSGLVLNAIVEGKAETYSQAHDLTIRCINEAVYALPEDLWSMEVYSKRFMEAMEKKDGSIVLDYRLPLLKK